MTSYIAGIDVGGTNIKMGIFSSVDMSLICKSEIKTPTLNQESEIIRQIKEEIVLLLESNNIKEVDVIGIGVAIPCPVREGYVNSCPNLSWKAFNVVEKIKEYFPNCPEVAVSNDASIAALGENESLDRPHNSAVFYTLGTGVGGGIIVDGNILEGAHGFGGEIGHMRVYEEEVDYCGCGSKGCLEQVCGTKGIFEYVKNLAKYEPTTINMEYLSVKAVFDAAKNGDSVALKTVDRVAKYIAISASIIAMILDPEVFIIGGGVSKAGQFLIDLIERHYKEEARFTSAKIPFVLAKTGNNAGIIGAAHFVNKRIRKI